jgi:hypothetical protein
VRFNGTNVTSIGTTLSVPGLLANTYSATVFSALAPSGQTEYEPASATSFPVQVTANKTVSTAFTTFYLVGVSTTGSGTATPASGWRQAGTTVTFSATPSGSDIFLGWSGTGAGSYNGTDPEWNLKLTGPVTELAAFGPPAPAASKTTSSSPSVWESPYLWAALAVVGLVVGLAIGVVIVRRRREPPAASTSAGGSEAAAYDEQAPDGGS